MLRRSLIFTSKGHKRWGNIFASWGARANIWCRTLSSGANIQDKTTVIFNSIANVRSYAACYHTEILSNACMVCKLMNIHTLTIFFQEFPRQNKLFGRHVLILSDDSKESIKIREDIWVELQRVLT